MITLANKKNIGTLFKVVKDKISNCSAAFSFHSTTLICLIIRITFWGVNYLFVFKVS